MNDGMITVTHTARAELAADTVKITVSANAEAKKYAEAAKKADALAEQAVSGLNGLGLAPRADGVNVYAVRADGKTSGYRATRTYSVEFSAENELLAQALDTLSECGCEFGASFFLKDDSHRDRLLADAVNCAHARAEAIAAAAGVKLGRLAKAEHMGSDLARPAMMFARSVGGSTDAEPARISVECTVTCSWVIE